MRVLIRTDASTRIGTGHVMRCLTLAKKLGEYGWESIFICRTHSGNLIGKIRSWGFAVHELPPGSRITSVSEPWLPAHASWLDASWQEDAEAVSGIILSYAGKGSVDGIIVDHYGLDAAWEGMLRPLVGWLATIDDLADRPHDCDMLLDQNLHENPAFRYRGLVPEGCRELFGPKYALLREEFATARAGIDRSPGRVRRLLVFFGGADLADDTLKTLEAISLADWGGKAADIVISEGHPRRHEILDRVAKRQGQTVHENVERMSELMSRADLAVGAGGTTSWERCCLGLPCLAICLADNQSELLESLHRKGALIYLGRSRDVSAASLAKSMLDLEARPEDLRSMSETASSLVDGEGAARVVSTLAGLSSPSPGLRDRYRAVPGPVLRKAEPGDAAMYFSWINDGETRRNSFDSSRVEWPGHFAWFRSKLADAKSYLFVLEIDGEAVGQIRFDLTGERAEIDYSVAPGFRGRGLGVALLNSGTAELQARLGRRIDFVGYVKRVNEPSAKAFLRAGFAPLAAEKRGGEACLVFGKTVRGQS